MKTLLFISLLALTSQVFASNQLVSIDLNLFDLKQDGLVKASGKDNDWTVRVVDIETKAILASKDFDIEAYRVERELGFFWDTPIPGIFRVLKSTGNVKLKRIVKVKDEGSLLAVQILNNKKNTEHTVSEFIVYGDDEKSLRFDLSSERIFEKNSTIMTEPLTKEKK